MKVINKFVLTSVVALFSFSANADYSGDDQLVIMVRTGQNITITLPHDIFLFENVIPGDQLTGTIPLSLNSDGSHSLSCTFDDIDISSTSADIDVDINLAGIIYRVAELDISIDDCSEGATSLSIVGTVPSGLTLPPDTTVSKTFEIGVNYADSGTIIVEEF